MRTSRSILVIVVTALVTSLTSFPAAADAPADSSNPAPVLSPSAPALLPSSPALTPSAPAPRTWLAPPQGGMVETQQAPKSSWRSYAILLFTLALGGGALYLRIHRQKQVIANASPALRVVSTVRVGPKAHLVMAQVGKKTLLLGVTDTAVQRVAWLDSDSLLEEPDQPEVSAEIRPKPAVQVPEPAPSLEQQAAFNNVLRNFMKVTQSRSQELEEPAEDAAVQIAKNTQDSFEESPSRSRSPKAPTVRRTLQSASPQESLSTSDDFEDQVSGLTRRQPRRRG